MSEREEKFERMLQNVQKRYTDTVQKMEQFIQLVVELPVFK